MSTWMPHPDGRLCLACATVRTHSEGQLCPTCVEEGHRVENNTLILNLSIRVPPSLDRERLRP